MKNDTIQTMDTFGAATRDAVVEILQRFDDDRIRNNGYFAIPARPVITAVWKKLYPESNPNIRSHEQHTTWEQVTKAALAYLGYSTEAEKKNGEWYYLKPDVEEEAPDAAEVEETDAEVAFQHRGAKAAVFKPRFGQAHQQYFSPKWVCEAMADIAEELFDVSRNKRVKSETGQWEDAGPSPVLSVIDPTCGSGCLLVPFAKRGHWPLGIELDERLAPVARRAVGKENVRHGDVCAYGAVLPREAYQVAVINPPYGIWWEIDENSYLSGYELGSDHSIESQNMVLEAVTKTLQNEGLLMALLSGRFFEVYPKALQYLKRNYQVIANLTLPRPYKAEYGIEVDSVFLVAYKVNSYTHK